MRGAGGAFSGVGGNLSFGRTREDGSFTSVETQAGINAGDGGFAINVTGATDLVGAIISSTADASNNRLATATLTTSDLENRERYNTSLH